MNNKKHTTEELLQKGKDIGLSENERTLMKSELLSYAQYHEVKKVPQQQKTKQSFIWVRTFSASFAALLLVVVGGGFASAESLPGEPLYAVKIHVLEEIVGATKFSQHDKLEYSVSILEERIAEVHQLTQEETELTPELQAIITEELAEATEEIEDVLQEAEELEDREILDATNNMVAITQATQKLMRGSASIETESGIEEITDSATALHAITIQEFFTEESEAEVKTYIEEQLTEITRELAENDVASSTAEVMNAYLQDIQEALAAKDIASASQLVSNALQNIETQEYLTDFIDERAEE